MTPLSLKQGSMMQNDFSMSKRRATIQFERKAIDKSRNCKE
jgi:hypothetical protein